MNNLLKIHAELTEDDLNQLWEKGLFVFDANVLLDLYRFPENAKEDLLNILSDKKINKRIWLPFQVILEFTNNRLEAVSDQKNKFAQVKSILCKSIEKVRSSYEELKTEVDKLQLKKRHSVINPDSYINEELFREPLSKINEFISQLDELEKRQPDVNDKDLLQKKILKIFNNKIANSFTKEDLEKFYKEGENRYKEQIPPGYKDDKKEGFYLFEDKKFVRKFGDLIVWKEIINKAKEENLEFIVLVTGDIKEDWWQEKRGKKLGVRYELLNEIYFEASSVKLFHIYDTSNFMKYAKQYLDINVKDDSISEAKDLLEFKYYTTEKSSINDKSKIIYRSIHNLIKSTADVVSNELNITYINNLEADLLLSLSLTDIKNIILEILINALFHSSDKTIQISMGNATANFYAISFKNNIGENSVFHDYQKGINEFRGHGLTFIKNRMERYGFVEISSDNKTFEIILLINKKYVKLVKSGASRGIRI